MPRSLIILIYLKINRIEYIKKKVWMILCFTEFQLCLELVIFYLLHLQALSLVFLLYHLITQEYIEEAAKQHTDYGGNRHILSLIHIYA